MIVRKLRLQQGWSQEQLSEFSGLSIRTIQRIERGQNASVESLKSLAAVFEIELADLTQEKEMNDNTAQANYTSNSTHASITQDEASAIEYVKDIKGFYSHLIKYACVMTLLVIINLVTSPNYIWVIWPALGWGVGVISHGLSVFEVFSFFSPQWEKKQVEKRLGRKL